MGGLALSELDASPVLTLTEIHRALAGRARRTQQVAQAVLFLRLRGLGPAQIRERLGIDETWLDRGEALTFEAEQAVLEHLGEDGLLDDERGRAVEGPMGCLVLKMADVMAERVRHAEQILMLRASGWRSAADIREKMGAGEESFRVAQRWLEDAGLTIKEEPDGVSESNGRAGGRS